MYPFFITTVSSLILSILLITLSIRVIGLRRSGKNTLPETLERAVRGHGNLTEYAPLFLILLGLAEFYTFPQMYLVVASTVFIIGRYIHGILFAFLKPNMILRIASMVMTFTGFSMLIGIHIYKIFLFLF